MKKPCIYKITNPKGLIYIGQTIDYTRRFKSYYKLRCKSQIRLYRSFKKYGVKNHLFEIIEFCEREELNNKERFWQEYYNCCSRKSGLNLVLTSTNEKKLYTSKEVRKKISKALIGKKQSLETINKRIRKGKDNKLYGTKLKQETKEKIRNKLLGTKQKKETIDKRIKKLKGKKRSEKTIDKLKKSHLSYERNRKYYYLNVETGIYYYSVKDASMSLSININTFKNNFDKKRKNNTNFIKV